MIPHNELRTGNYILVDRGLQKVSAINTDGGAAGVGWEARNATGYEPLASDRVQPVPLTDDVLQQCGFVFHDYFKFWQRIGTVAGKESEMDIDREHNVIDFMRRPVGKKLASLHQLQNIYFALRGEEIAVAMTEAPASGQA